ncbi:DUF5655 domain-containing protein [Apibacter sp. B2966]|uniref:DUF5655 domain-containing protein n=1 Tax=Apibacter sp. B2966 TaxID=2656761 RepID=UPI00140D5891|nr:DUF5655 domain-containing protein [Apibacter sp. B2966]QII72393.1 hypothetical protein G8C43_06295 [Apibacter sp. B2966]
MFVLSQNKNQLSELKEKPFKLEKEIQLLFENNMEILTGLKYIKSEFTIKNSRIDTLAFDIESKAFVIIEYKRERNYSIIDQGVSYLNLMLEYKADFIVEYNETQKHSIKRNEVDWSQSRIIFVSPFFTEFQKQSSNFKDLAIELWEIKRYENNSLIINPIKKSKSAPSIKQIQSDRNSKISRVTNAIKVFTEEDHLDHKSEEVKELYEMYKNAILNLPANIEIEPKKLYIAFKKDKNIADIVLLKKGLKIFINKKSGELDDPKKLTRDVSKIGHWGNGDYELIVEDTHNLEYIMSLIKQAL